MAASGPLDTSLTPSENVATAVSPAPRSAISKAAASTSTESTSRSTMMLAGAGSTAFRVTVSEAEAPLVPEGNDARAVSVCTPDIGSAAML